MSEDTFDSFDGTSSSTYETPKTFLIESQANGTNGTTTYRLDKFFNLICQIPYHDRQEELYLNINILNSYNLPLIFRPEYINNNIYDSISDGNTYYILINQGNNDENNFLGHMRERTNIEEEEEKEERPDNMRTTFGSDFFNKYIKHKFESFFNMVNLRLRFETFPKTFYTKAVHIRSQHYLDKTLEEFITNKDLYKDDNISQIKFNNNLKVINTLKEVKCKNKLNEINFDNFLKKKYRDLIDDYLVSSDFKQKVKSLKTKKGIKEAKKYEYIAKHLIEYLQKKDCK